MTLEEFRTLAEPEGFQAFRFFTKSGWSMSTQMVSEKINLRLFE